MDKTVLNELNSFLEGNYMAVHGYERFIHHLKDENIKREFQSIQQDHKKHAAQVAERIQILGGVPSDGVGIKGAMAEMMTKISGATDNTDFIIKDALKSEDKGIKMAEEVVKGDLDPESQTLIRSILDADRKHLDRLNGLASQ